MAGRTYADYPGNPVKTIRGIFTQPGNAVPIVAKLFRSPNKFRPKVADEKVNRVIA